MPPSSPARRRLPRHQGRCQRRCRGPLRRQRPEQRRHQCRAWRPQPARRQPRHQRRRQRPCRPPPGRTTGPDPDVPAPARSTRARAQREPGVARGAAHRSSAAAPLRDASAARSHAPPQSEGVEVQDLARWPQQHRRRRSPGRGARQLPRRAQERRGGVTATPEANLFEGGRRGTGRRLLAAVGVAEADPLGNRGRGAGRWLLAASTHRSGI